MVFVLFPSASTQVFGGEEDSTRTPYKVNTRVSVITANGQIEGLLQKSNSEGWIFVQEFGHDEPTAIRLGAGVTLKVLNYDKDATVRYWEQAAAIMEQLYKIKPGSSRSFPEQQWFHTPNLVNAKNNLKKLNSAKVDKEAVEAVNKIVDAMEFATGPGSTLATAFAGMANNGNNTAALRAGMSIGEKDKELKEKASQAEAKARNYLSNTYNQKFATIKLPSSG